jgi:hypothetical protein
MREGYDTWLPSRARISDREPSRARSQSGKLASRVWITVCLPDARRHRWKLAFAWLDLGLIAVARRHALDVAFAWWVFGLRGWASRGRRPVRRLPSSGWIAARRRRHGSDTAFSWLDGEGVSVTSPVRGIEDCGGDASRSQSAMAKPRDPWNLNLKDNIRNWVHRCWVSCTLFWNGRSEQQGAR